MLTHATSIQCGLTRTFPPGVFLGLGVLAQFEFKNKTRTTVKIYKNFEL